ncbi:uncharacterized protein LOC116006334 isoform X2 [Ipomoea triloba]|uniref:uncharacterized protein LOC116006334 isoform X2 n=1 Tax=Ipomoea triloba TaxID=35885 RepID=UPI00125E2FFB|nr:uncharacterized protein LOC116006334 isoform X2 [Ipomoea triloba]
MIPSASFSLFEVQTGELQFPLFPLLATAKCELGAETRPATWPTATSTNTAPPPATLTSVQTALRLRDSDQHRLLRDLPSARNFVFKTKHERSGIHRASNGIRKISFELLELKDAMENMCGNSRTKCLAFLRNELLVH